METRSLKALSMLRLQGNRQGNQKETLSFSKETFKETATENGGAPALLIPADSSRPELKAWITESGELRTSGNIDGLAGEIVKLTADNLPEQKRLLLLHCEKYDKHHFHHLAELWQEQVARIEFDAGLTRDAAEVKAAELLHCMAFLPELRLNARI